MLFYVRLSKLEAILNSSVLMLASFWSSLMQILREEGVTVTEFTSLEGPWCCDLVAASQFDLEATPFILGLHLITLCCVSIPSFSPLFCAIILPAD